MARPRRRPRKTVYILNTLAILAALWLGGFVWFVAALPEAPQQPTRRTDGIVVLTGGAYRIALAARLLADGMAERMLVSGVYNLVDDETLRRSVGISPELFACCVDLGRAATNTAENAQETATWAADHNYRSLRVVTDYDHMPRSLKELQRAMPTVELIAHPVSRYTVGKDMKRASLSRLALEYLKFSRVALSVWSADLWRALQEAL